MSQVSDINIQVTDPLPTPREIRNELPITEAQATQLTEYRKAIAEILFGDDPRLMVIVGPCSIHDTEAGLEYARRLKALSDELSDRMFMVMRAYFEKPRTSVGWKGLIMDPELDDSCNLPLGLRRGRQFLRDLLAMGIPTATELLDPITPQYIADVIAWSAVGARTSESQTHRQMASGLSMPLGFKNTTSGNLQAAVNAIKAASASMTFMGIDEDGKASAVTTKGNPHCHIILRGGSNGPNYSDEDLDACAELLRKNGLIESITVDCSHANSNKDHRLQPEVMRSVIAKRLSGLKAMRAVMIEGNINPGNQKFPSNGELAYGVSITDACLGWDETEALLRETYQKLG